MFLYFVTDQCSGGKLDGLSVRVCLCCDVMYRLRCWNKSKKCREKQIRTQISMPQWERHLFEHSCSWHVTVHRRKRSSIEGSQRVSIKTLYWNEYIHCSTKTAYRCCLLVCPMAWIMTLRVHHSSACWFGWVISVEVPAASWRYWQDVPLARGEEPCHRWGALWWSVRSNSCPAHVRKTNKRHPSKRTRENRRMLRSLNTQSRLSRNRKR